ncbi:SAM-dependent methyltransferase [Streptomyces sp. CRN 30]|uniref:SAM-dependent methyltransferase n=1 Tax=Streptomyces sp. CRN 30 TaxID=3075613 RepID=UPI002A8384B9|nr:SAM-dependent methyltransferase [Streptomyces sp. CRN 30]
MSALDGSSGTPRIDTGRPHPARMYDWFLGGKDNYPVDEAMGRQLMALEPNIPVITRINRAFMQRATHWAATRGIRQFLDIGTGIPTEPNLHQVAQRVAPEARVVYCDHDPIVLAHAEALLRGTPEGALDYVQADARDTGLILERAGKVLDFDRPVALSMIALLHFLSDEDGAGAVVDRLKEVLAPGSCVVLSHISSDFHSQEIAREADDRYRASGLTLAPRGRAAFTRFFEGLDLVEPGVVLAEDWHPELGEPVEAPGGGFVSAMYAAVARKP